MKNTTDILPADQRAANTATLKRGFTSKEQYLVWRKAWKENYRELAAEIREYKATRKSPDAGLRACAQYNCWRLRHAAAEMLEQCKQSKLEAQRQYLASRCLQPTPC